MAIKSITRVKPKYHQLFGVEFPLYVDCSYDRRRTEEQMALARKWLAKFGHYSLEKTCLEWVGISLTEINFAAMKCLILALQQKFLKQKERKDGDQATAQAAQQES
jgi:hypothetical protein